MSQQQPSDEELRAALEEEMRRLTVQDVIVQSVITLVNLTGRRLGLASQQGEADKDLEQARLGIDAVRALLPLVPEEPRAAIQDALSQLQMAYAQQVGAGGETQEAGGGPQQAQDQPAADSGQPTDEERATARSKIWTPPGS
jgi:hypothetical protein